MLQLYYIQIHRGVRTGFSNIKILHNVPICEIYAHCFQYCACVCFSEGVATVSCARRSSGYITRTAVDWKPPALTYDFNTCGWCAHVGTHTEFSSCVRSYGSDRGHWGLLLVVGRCPATNHSPPSIRSQRYREQNILQACLSAGGCVGVFYCATPSQTIDI